MKLCARALIVCAAMTALAAPALAHDAVARPMSELMGEAPPLGASPSIVLAHDAYDWIAKGQYRSSSGELCCGRDDCHEVKADRVMSHRDGVILPDHGNLVVPGRQIQISEDGKYWVCKAGTRLRCFFAPFHGN